MRLDRALVRPTEAGGDLPWCLRLSGAPDGRGEERTRVDLHLLLAPVRHRRLAGVGGGPVNLLTIAGLAAGLREQAPRVR